MKEMKSFEEMLEDWLKEQDDDFNKTRFKNLMKRNCIDNFESVLKYIERNEKRKKNPKTTKMMKKFYNDCNYVKEEKEYDNNEYVIAEKVEKVNIKNSYINLIRNKIDMIDNELNEKDIDDYIIDELKNIYDIMDFYF